MKQIHASRPASADFPLPARARILQRKCACGSHASGGECESCRQKSEGATLQRSAARSEAAQGGVPPIVQEVLQSPGRPLDAATRAVMEPRFGHDFSGVRIHADTKAAQSAQAVGAHAYTVGRDIAFADGKYSSATAGTRLLAHELAHVVQQSGIGQTGNGDAAEREAESVAAHVSQGGQALVQSAAPVGLQRDAAAPEWQKKSAAEIMAEENYIDKNIIRIEYYFGQEADIFYKDGSKLHLGLIPEQISGSILSVDYRTLRSEHVKINTDAPNQLKFIPRGIYLKPPEGTSYDDVVTKATMSSQFVLDSASKRIVPTHLNSLTAPLICQMLRQAETEYIQTTNATAQGMVKALKILEVALMIYSMRPGMSAASGAGRAGAGAAAGVATAERTLLQEFLALLKSGASKGLTVEGVLFDGVRVFKEGTVLVVRRFGIKSMAEAGQGRILQGAYERAAIEAGKQSGAKSVRIMMETVVNPKWRGYLESQGYTKQVFETAAGGAEGLWVKIITL